MSSGAPPIRNLQLNEAVRPRVMGHGSSMEEKSVTADIVSRRSVKEEASNLYHHPFSSPTSLIG